MTEREVAIFTAFADTVIAPEPALPPITSTDAAQSLGSWLALAPKLNAAALRAAINVIDVAPLALGHRRTLRRLPRTDRARYLRQLETSSQAAVRQAVKALKGVAFLTYYGDDEIMRTLGYDADANVARGKALRIAEGRP